MFARHTPCLSISPVSLFVGVCVFLLLPRSSIAQPTVEYALGLKPHQKKQNIDYDIPTGSSITGATVKMEKDGDVTAWVVRDDRGQVLRVFADTNGDRVVDQWSFFKNGLEVYRDIDSDFNTKADEARWFNTAGSRWGVDRDEDGVLDAWKMISAEEVTVEIVAAFRLQDASRFARLLPSGDEIEKVGFSGNLSRDVKSRVTKAASEFAQLAQVQKQIGPKTLWSNMLSMRPGVIPSGSDGCVKDIVAHDNVVALVDTAGVGGQVYVGSLVRFGDAWRPIDAPQLPGSSGVITEPQAFFAPRFDGPTASLGPQEDSRLKPLLMKLQVIEEKLSSASFEGRRPLAEQQADLLGQVVAASSEADKAFWVRQYAETLAAGVQDGSLPSGISKLEKLASAVEVDESLSAFTLFRLASARYAARMQEPGADIESVQSAWLEELEKFVDDYPAAPDSAEAMLQMGIADEFSGREDNAIGRYEAIVERFPDSASARKARGAARRLQLDGKPLRLEGIAMDGKNVALENLQGAPVLVHYWATWCEPCKVDIATIRELYSKYGPRRFRVVGITLDSDVKQLDSYLSEKPMPWPQLHESGGLDGRLAEDLGVLTLPTMILLDSDGNVVDRNLVITDLERKLESLIEGN